MTAHRLQSAAKFAGSAVGVLLATVGVLFLLLLGAYALPGGAVRGNIVRSVPLLQQEGLYPEFFGFKLFQMDNYTDTVMLFEAASADETPPLTAMMTNTAYNVDNFTTLPQDLAVYLDARASGTSAEGLTPFSYARYWHGYLIWLRPLLLVFTYGQIRVVNYLLGGALLALLLWRIAARCGRRAAWWFGISQVLVSCFFVPRQLQFFTCFVLAYAACLWVLARPRRPQALLLGLAAVGAATAFMDLLVTPILTLGLPMTVWLLQPGDRAEARRGLRGCGTVAGGSIVWGAGYGGAWALKWAIAPLVTGADVAGDALHQAQVRTAGDTWHGMTLSWGNIFRFVGQTLVSRGLVLPLVLALGLGAVLFCLCVRSRAALAAHLPLALTALMAPVWFAVLRTHSIQHGWFVWRGLAVTLFAGTAFVAQTCAWSAGKQRLLRLRPRKNR